MPVHGYLRHPPKQLQPFELFELAYEAGITDAIDLLVCGQISLSESQGYPGAFNDNFKDDTPESVWKVPVWTPEHGYDDDVAAMQRPWISQRDCGLWQCFVTAAEIGTDVEEQMYDPEHNAKVMVGKFKSNGWNPWAAFTHDIYLNRSYVRRATRGYGNWLASRAAAMQAVNGKADQSDTPPMLDFHWWVAEMSSELREIRAEVAKAKRLMPSAAVLDELKRIDALAVKAVNVPKQGALPD